MTGTETARAPVFTPQQLRELWLRFVELGARTGRRDADDLPLPPPSRRPDPTPHNVRVALLRAELVRLADWLKRRSGDREAWLAFAAVFLDLRLVGETMGYRLQFVLDDWHEDGIEVTQSALERRLDRALHWMAWASGWRPPPGYRSWGGWIAPES